MPAWRQAVNLVERLAKRALADCEGKTKSGDVQRFVDIRKGQLLGFFDELAARLVAVRKRFFCSACDQVMNDHRTAPGLARRSYKVLPDAAGHGPVLRRYCPLGQTKAFGRTRLVGEGRVCRKTVIPRVLRPVLQVTPASQPARR